MRNPLGTIVFDDQVVVAYHRLAAEFQHMAEQAEGMSASFGQLYATMEALRGDLLTPAGRFMLWIVTWFTDDGLGFLREWCPGAFHDDFQAEGWR